MPFPFLPFFNYKKTSAPTKGSIFLEAKAAESTLKAKLASPSVIKYYLNPLNLFATTMATLSFLQAVGAVSWCFRFSIQILEDILIQNKIIESNHMSQNFLIKNLELEIQSIYLIIILHHIAKGGSIILSTIIDFSVDELDKINKGLTGIGKKPLSERTYSRVDTNRYLGELSEGIHRIKYRNSVNAALSVLPDELMEHINEFNDEVPVKFG